MVFLYKVIVSDDENVNAFIKFMNEEYILSTHKGAMRVSEIEKDNYFRMMKVRLSSYGI